MDISDEFLSKPNSSQTSNNLVWEYEISLGLVNTHLSNEINSIILNGNKYGSSSISTKQLSSFLKKLENAYYLVTKDLKDLNKEIYLLHQICTGLYEYYDLYLKDVSYEKYRSLIIFPNLIYILVRFYHKASGFFQANIRKIYNEYRYRNSGIINKFTSSYYLDEDLLKNEILFQFLGNALRKFNPLNIDNINSFYRQIMRSIFFYYFKSDRNLQNNYINFSDSDFILGKNINLPTRQIYYRDVLYNLQIKKMCNSSIVIKQLNYNYNIFKNIIINNEFQNMYYSLTQDSFMLKNNQYKLLNLYNDNKDSNYLKKLKDLPIIYQLLRCIHIMNPKKKPYNKFDIKPDYVKSIILEELAHPFKNLFMEQYIYTILERTSSNFVDNILCGEYINPVTFSSITIKDYSFVTQLKQFVQLCLIESGVSNG